MPIQEFIVTKISLEYKNEEESVMKAMKNFTLKNCIYTVAECWNSLSQSTITNSWHKMRVSLEPEVEQSSNAQIQLVKIIEESLSYLNIHDTTADEYIMSDYDEKGYVYMSDEQIAEEVLYQENISNHNLSEEEKQMESSEELEITHKDALVAINTLIQYVEKDPEIASKSSEFFNSVRSLIELKALSEIKQRRIQDFFK